ncbi:MAG: DUF951 domain-containing protein, partial [Caldilineales bacterium]
AKLLQDVYLTQIQQNANLAATSTRLPDLGLCATMDRMVLEIRLDDIARLRKPHPCGSYDWRVVRVGADIGLQCTTCQRRVLLTRRDFEKRLKTFISRGPTADLST